jgi:hypothetical protein
MKQLSILFFCASIPLFIGCGGVEKPAGMPDLHPTSLTFTQGGPPLAGASVTLIAQDAANSQWSIGGPTDSRGVLNVHTQGFKGAPEGSYKIVVTKTESEGSADVAVVESSDTGGPAPAASGSAKSFYLVDKKYRSAGTTDLTLEVKSGKNAETFDLGTAVREEIPVHKN